MEMEPTALATNLDMRTTDATVDPTDAPAALVEDELLVEEISIDGMCGVY